MASNNVNAARALAEYKAAVSDIQALQRKQAKAGIREENADYWRANQRVLDAEKKVKKWRALAVYMFGR